MAKGGAAKRIRVSEADRLSSRVYVVLRKDELERLDKVITPALSPSPTQLLTRNAVIRALINGFIGRPKPRV